MKSAVVGVIAIVIVVVGVLVYRSISPAEEVTTEETAPAGDVEKTPGSQFIQLAPQADLPEDVDADAADGLGTSTIPTDGAAAPDSENAAVSAEGTDVTIAMTDTGFSATTVTVPVGATVTFVNNGQGNHWPASFIHPTHQVLSGFDALRGLATGETYSYTFNEAGNWSFHDHLFPSFTGTIVVSSNQ